jgi:hypothetical protein
MKYATMTKYRTIYCTCTITRSVLVVKSVEVHLDRRGRDRIAVGFTTTYAISAYHQGDVYKIM